ncbi:SMP-30/gluconolactonase/LRE family protein [Amnibacterium sp. CER49]|uniref:SMP-30/gluconolactonase/LRE family protein n=1 Tax=Amnibacterium sp. CER49 TaxID=3039161 RepID=UPI00244A6758|nr:SMP-30/gluconolactonase/LRE family protein [Amnibacterium sp. CER49]MDH2444008.1 SMP-30/gluconolactonase/LRE family protein [Amnibacterium sp. CER49]
MQESSGATAWERDRTIVRFPDPAIEVVDERFRSLIVWQEVVERLWTGGRWLEGPVWFGDGRYLLFSDIPNDRMLRWSEETGQVTVFRQPSEHSNGNTRDRQGRLVTCEHRTRRVTRTEHDGTITVLADRFEGRRLNAPNDVVVAADGGIWFTDPGYGSDGDYEGDKGEHELPRYVYRIDPDTLALEPVVRDMDRPNGLAFSPDERLLYVVDKDIRVYDMVDGRPENGRRHIDMGAGTSDGMRIDRAGNLWTAAFGGGADYDGVHCFDPDGVLLGRIHLPENTANLTFGGRKKNRLFITGGRSLYSVFVDAHGAQTP